MEDNEKVVVETKSDQRLFTMVYHDFLTSKLLNYYEKIIFIMLKKHADSKTHEAYPSLATISKETGISKRKVQNCLNHMEELKVIKRKRRKTDNGDYTSNLYTLHDYAKLWKDGVLPKESEPDDKQRLLEQIEQEYVMINKKDLAKTSTKKYLQSLLESNNIPTDNNTENQEKSQEAQERYPEQWIIDFYNLNELKAENPTKAAVIDTVANILYTILNSTKETIRVNGEDKPTMAVVGRMLKLNQETIMYAIDQFIKQTDKIKNPKAYMITCLYNAQEQYELALHNQVSHDLAHYED
jgi:DNA-binding Lrp family transcriptional regulator